MSKIEIFITIVFCLILLLFLPIHQTLKKIVKIVLFMIGGGLIFLVLAFLYVAYFGKRKQDLGDGYYFMTKDEAIDIGFPGNTATIYRSCSHDEDVFSNILLTGEIIGVEYDEKEIRAKVVEDNHEIIYHIQKGEFVGEECMEIQ